MIFRYSTPLLPPGKGQGLVRSDGLVSCLYIDIGVVLWRVWATSKKLSKQLWISLKNLSKRLKGSSIAALSTANSSIALTELAILVPGS